MFKKAFFIFCTLFSFLTLNSLSAALPDASLFFAAAEKSSPEQAQMLLKEVDNLAEIEIFTNQLINLLEQKYKIKIDKEEISQNIAKDISYHQLVKKIKMPGRNYIAKQLIKKGKKKFDLSFNSKKLTQKLASVSDGAAESKTLERSALMIKNFQQFLKGIGFTTKRTLVEIPPEMLLPFTEILTGSLLCHIPDPKMFTSGIFLMVEGTCQSMSMIKEKEKMFLY